MSKLYLVTGATGFIGSHLVRQLVANGDRIKILTRQKRLPSHLQDFDHPAIEWVLGDLLQPDSFRDHLYGIDGVYHLAGYISTARADAKKVWQLDYQVTHNLLNELKTVSVPRLVYLASIFALAGGDKVPVNEEARYNLSGNPVTYFQAKRQAELEVRAAAKDMDIVFTYPCFCYGPGDALISSSRLLLMHLRRQLPICFSGGLNSMDVRDAASALILSMQKGEAGRQYLVGGVNQTYKEFFNIAAEVTGVAAPVLQVPNAALPALGEIGQRLAPSLGLDSQAAWMARRFWYYDDSRARQELGHQSRPLQHTLSDATQWFIDHKFCKSPPNFR